MGIKCYVNIMPYLCSLCTMTFQTFNSKDWVLAFDAWMAFGTYLF